jgi:hypothetical protein
MIPAAAAAALLLVVVAAFAVRGGQDDNAEPTGVSNPGLESELIVIENARQLAEQRKNDTDPRAYVAADSILAAAAELLALLRTAGVPAALQLRVAQIDSALNASRASVRSACRNEREVLETTTIECPEG